MKVKVACEVLKDVTVNTNLTVKCIHLGGSHPELLSFLYLSVSCHWVPQIWKLTHVPRSWHCHPLQFRASCDIFHSKLGFKHREPAICRSLALWIPELPLVGTSCSSRAVCSCLPWFEGQPDIGCLNWQAGPHVDACLPPRSHEQVYYLCAHIVEQLKIWWKCLIGKCSS